MGMNRRWRLALVLACAVPACAAVIAVATAGSSTDSSPPPSTAASPAAAPSAQGKTVSEAYRYHDLAQMQATSDLVISGTVVAIEPGRAIGGSGGKDEFPAEEEYTVPSGAIRLNDVVVRVDEWLGGTSKTEPGSEIVLEEETPVAALAASSQIGDSGVYFVLEKADHPGAYGLSGSPARFLQTGDSEALLSSNAAIDWAAKAASQSLDALQAQIREIQDDVDRGEIEPARPLG
jgi:hypothetical protein